MSTEPVPQRNVPFYRPDIGDEEIAAVVHTLRSGWLTVGPQTQEFEQQFARTVGAAHAVAVSSCTAALHLALDALDIEPGDEVITSTLTFAATGATIVHSGARPVLADCTRDTLNIDPADVARKVTPRTRAVVPVHFAGQPAPMDELLEIARQHRLKIVEDAAHALPASYHGRSIGTIGDLTAFSFYATKNLTTGEGGMLTLTDGALADRLRTRRLHGMSRDAWRRYSAQGSWRYDVSYPGFKYNMTDIAASMGLVQLQRLPALHRRRQAIVALYDALLRDRPELEPLAVLPNVQHAWHLYVVRIRPERLRIDRDTLIEQLKAQGVATAVHFIPLHLHSFYRDAFGYRPQDFPVASAAAETILSLPLFTLMSDDDVRYVAAALGSILDANRQ
ncbi:MAG TPA: DegT/DnrJ/EryC1/StrS aminotransferase family protein [Candidatus Margulisiibacteriota bacterium]|nr:DegT/DnrJ/EryC1/StrS aminotransferase family protein [Candidatus Margulisiibacteriota bacterium]